jgi:hypothetical protein
MPAIRFAEPVSMSSKLPDITVSVRFETLCRQNRVVARFLKTKPARSMPDHYLNSRFKFDVPPQKYALVQVNPDLCLFF